MFVFTYVLSQELLESHLKCLDIRGLNSFWSLLLRRVRAWGDMYSNMDMGRIIIRARNLQRQFVNEIDSRLTNRSDREPTEGSRMRGRCLFGATREERLHMLREQVVASWS